MPTLTCGVVAKSRTNKIVSLEANVRRKLLNVLQNARLVWQLIVYATTVYRFVRVRPSIHLFVCDWQTFVTDDTDSSAF